jgi:hypothetical protein
MSGFDASVEEQTALDQYLRDVSRHELITPDGRRSSVRSRRRVTRRRCRSSPARTCVS